MCLQHFFTHINPGLIGRAAFSHLNQPRPNQAGNVVLPIPTQAWLGEQRFFIYINPGLIERAVFPHIHYSRPDDEGNIFLSILIPAWVCREEICEFYHFRQAWLSEQRLLNPSLISQLSLIALPQAWSGSSSSPTLIQAWSGGAPHPIDPGLVRQHFLTHISPGVIRQRFPTYIYPGLIRQLFPTHINSGLFWQRCLNHREPIFVPPFLLAVPRPPPD